MVLALQALCTLTAAASRAPPHPAPSPLARLLRRPRPQGSFRCAPNMSRPPVLCSTRTFQGASPFLLLKCLFAGAGEAGGVGGEAVGWAASGAVPSAARPSTPPTPRALFEAAPVGLRSQSGCCCLELQQGRRHTDPTAARQGARATVRTHTALSALSASPLAGSSSRPSSAKMSSRTCFSPARESSTALSWQMPLARCALGAAERGRLHLWAVREKAYKLHATNKMNAQYVKM